MDRAAARRGPPVDGRAALKDGALAGGVALALTLPLVGLRTVEVQSRLAIEFHLAEVAVTGLLVFLGRLGLSLAAGGLPGPVLAAALAAAAAGWLLPFPTETLRVLALAGAAVVAARALWALHNGRDRLSRQDRDRRMDRLGARLQDASRLLGPAAAAMAVAGSRDSAAHLHHARLGPQHRGRARRPA